MKRNIRGEKQKASSFQKKRPVIFGPVTLFLSLADFLRHVCGKVFGGGWENGASNGT